MDCHFGLETLPEYVEDDLQEEMYTPTNTPKTIILSNDDEEDIQYEKKKKMTSTNFYGSPTGNTQDN